MKIQLLSATLILLFQTASWTQDVTLVTESEVTASCVAMAQDQGFALTNVLLDENALNGGVELQNVQSSGSNLILTLNLQKLIRGEFYELSVAAVINGRKFDVRPEALNQHVIPWNQQGTGYQITWFNAFEDAPLVGRFELQINVRFYGQPCTLDAEPRFAFKDRLPYVISGMVGAAFIGVSEYILLPEATKEYDKYVSQIVGEDRLGIAPEEQEHDSGPKGLHEAEDHYNDVKNKESTVNLVRRSGQVIIAGSLVFYVIRHFKHRSDSKKWERYCNRSSRISLRPMYDTTVPGQSVGLTFTVKF